MTKVIEQTADLPNPVVTTTSFVPIVPVSIAESPNTGIIPNPVQVQYAKKVLIKRNLPKNIVPGSKDKTIRQYMSKATDTLEVIFSQIHKKFIYPLTEDEFYKLSLFEWESQITDKKERRDFFEKYWKDYTVRLPYNGLELNINIDEDLIKYKLIQTYINTNTIIALNKSVFNAGVHKFWVEDLEQKAEQASKSVRSKVTAFSELEKMDSSFRRDFCYLYGKTLSGYSDNAVIEFLDKKVSDNPDDFLKRLNDSLRPSRILLEKCLQKGIVTTDKATYYFGSVILGSTIEIVLAFMKAPKNQDVLIEWNRQLAQ